MNNWQQEKLGDIADVKLSNVDKKVNENEREVRLCNYTDVYKNSFIDFRKAIEFMVATCNENEFEKFILRKGQVAITKDSETRDDIGVPTYILEDFEDVVLGYHLSLITPNEVKLNGRFLYYWLNSKQARRYFENNAGGSGQRCTLPLEIIKSTPINLPSLSIQKKIASILSNLDTKIELNNRINAELEAMAKTVYDYWFVQFDFPNGEGKPYRTEGGKMVWSDELKREIPEGWEVKSLKEIANTGSGGTPLSSKNEYYENGNIPWINSGELNNPYILHTKNYITDEGLSNSSAKMFPAKTLLVALYGATAGKVSLLLIPACSNQAVCAILTKDKVYTTYLKFAFTDLYKYLINLSSGSARDNLSQDLINDLKFTIPNKPLLTSFDSIVTPIVEKISININENQQLTQLRDWLLPMLMNGQVRVNAAE